MTINIISHRGSGVGARENTVAAFAAALKQGAHSFECDVRFTRDLKPVIHHDFTALSLFRKLTPIKRLTLAQIQHLSTYHDASVNSLDDVLNFLGFTNAQCYLHLKDVSRLPVLGILRQIERSHLAGQMFFVIPGSEYGRLQSFGVNPNRIVVMVPYPFFRFGHNIARSVCHEVALLAPPGILNLDAAFLRLVETASGQARAVGHRVSVGLGDTVSTLQWLSALPVDGIWTNQPVLCNDVLQRAARLDIAV
ncbi:MAG: hypothetical protein HYT63_01760 [Candidatus Yanofskybacteria bacterium]|nr:hypothetical protein [Candidatus Yanofskybacteria bacterium]